MDLKGSLCADNQDKRSPGFFHEVRDEKLVLANVPVELVVGINHLLDEGGAGRLDSESLAEEERVERVLEELEEALHGLRSLLLKADSVLINNATTAVHKIVLEVALNRHVSVD